MSLPTTLDALIAVALIFVPGFIFGQLIRRTIAHFPETVDGRHFLAIFASGVFLHVLVFPFWTRFILDWYLDGTIAEHWFATYAWILFVIFIWPVLVGVATSVLIPKPWVDQQLDRIGLGYVDRTPSAWDYAVRDRRTKWVKVYLRDGSVLGGWFGTDSFASLYSPRKDIYLEQMWILQNGETFVEEQVNTDGVWIGHDVISHIVFQIGVDDD